MEFSALQRRLAFGLIVLVLVGLAAYLIGPGARGAGRPTAHPSRTASAISPSSSPPPSAPVDPSAPVQSTVPDIYQWLPFSQTGLAAAASVARRFGAAYGTFSYAETAAAYAAPLRALSSAALVGQIEAAYSLPGMAAARSKDKQVATGTAVIQSIRAFGPTSITFIVQITQHQTTASGRTASATSYAVTLTGVGSTWQVTGIELAVVGNS
jgi:hypothetical protein